MLSDSRRKVLMRVAAVAAVATPALMWTGFLGVGLATPHYNLLTRAASDLGAAGALYAGIFDAGFFVLPGLLTVLFAAGLLAARPRSAWWRLGALLVVAEGVLLLLAGLNSEDPASPSLTGRHQALASFCFLAAALAPLVLALGLVRTPRSAVSAVLTATSLPIIAVEAAGLLTSRFIAYPDGLFQRPFGLALTAWFLAGAAWLWAQAGAIPAPAPDVPRLAPSTGS